MATTMQDLLDDDSSDDDDFNPEEKGDEDTAGVAASLSVRRVIQEVDDDESSSNDGASKSKASNSASESKQGETGDDADKPTSATGAPAQATEATTTTTSNDAPRETTTQNKDDDDDEDVEFNDDGVVGLSGPARDETTESGASQAAATPSNEQRPPKKPRHIQVLESDRPPPDTSLHITKLPNLVGIQTEPFDPDTYSASLEEQDYHVSVHSMIRWRYAKDEHGEFKRDTNGNLIRESNARLVAWDDGNGGPKSYTLHVGNEVFEVDANDSSLQNGFAGLNGYLYLSQKATLADDEHTPAGTVLESMGAIQSRLVARPSSLQSEAHKKLTVAVRQKTIKKARIAEYVTQEDPEKAKQERIKVKQDLEKASARKRQSSGYRRPAMNRRYLEEDDGNYDSVNIRDLKRGRDLDDEDMDYGEDSEEEEEDDSMFNRRRPKRTAAKRQHEFDDDEEDELVFEEESDEEDVQIKATSRKKLQHQALVDDDDDE